MPTIPSIPSITELAIEMITKERDRLNAALIALGATAERKRGRPRNSGVPDFIGDAAQVTNSEPPAAPVGRNWKPAARKRQAAAMRARWAEAKANGQTTLTGKRKNGLGRKPETMAAGGAG